MSTQFITKIRRGFTLTEALIAVGISTFIMGGLAHFFIDSHQLLFTMEGKNQINKNMRELMNELTEEATSADEGIIYEDFASGGLVEKQNSQSGDLLVIVTRGEKSDATSTADPPITKLVGYFRSIDDTVEQIGPVRKFTVEPTGTAQYSSVINLIPDFSTASNWPTVIELSRGFANGKLFYNLDDNRTMVNGQIYHGNQAKEVTDTFNFTVTYRGSR